MKLLRTLLASPWMVDARTATAYMPLVQRLMEGEEVSFAQAPVVAPYSLAPMSNDGEWAPWPDDADTPTGPDEDPEMLIRVYPVRGMITKEDQECGPDGTETLMRRMLRADGDPTVIGHLLDIDSGGGEGTNIETVCNTIRQRLTKPVVAVVNGYAASAAYWIAVGADEIYAQESTDVVGSVGVYFAWADTKKMWEKRGVTFHEVYAEQSDMKNEEFQAANEGDYEPLRLKLANPYADAFITSVKAMRPKIKDSRVWRGAIFMAPEAIELGMIDGIATLEQAAERVRTLRATQKSNNNAAAAAAAPKEGSMAAQADFSLSTKQTQMSGIDRIKAALGIKANDELVLTPEQAEALAQQIVPEAAATNAALASVQGTMADIAKAVGNLNEAITSMKTELGELKTQLNELEKAPGASITAGAAAADAPLLTAGLGITPEQVEAELAIAAKSGGIRVVQ